MMNKRPISGGNANRSIVPIFCNKKRRIKQALYANPVSEKTVDIDDNFMETTENKWNYVPQERSHPKTAETCTSQYFSSSRTTGSVGLNQCKPNFQQPNAMVSRRNFEPGFVRGQDGANLNGHVKVQKSYQGFGGNKNAWESKQRPNPPAKPLLKTLPPPVPGSHSRTAPIKDVRASLNNSKMRPSYQQQPQKDEQPINNPTKSVKEQSKHQIQSKQVNLMKEQMDKSLKVITATIVNAKKWSEFRDQMVLLFEIFGTLDSPLTTNTAANGKNFILRDSTGTIRCTYWEMDQSMPRLIRGQLHRCMGSIDRRTGIFNCASIRPTHPNEHKILTVSLEVCEKAMNEYLATFREY